jgi:hypothetical protein
MDVLTVEGRNEALVELGHNRMRRPVGIVLDVLNLLDPGSEIMGILENTAQEFGSFGQVAGKLGEHLEELCFVGYEAHDLPLRE